MLRRDPSRSSSRRQSGVSRRWGSRTPLLVVPSVNSLDVVGVKSTAAKVVVPVGVVAPCVEPPLSPGTPLSSLSPALFLGPHQVLRRCRSSCRSAAVSRSCRTVLTALRGWWHLHDRKTLTCSQRAKPHKKTNSQHYMKSHFVSLCQAKIYFCHY